MIELVNICKNFKDGNEVVKVLQGINMTINDGDYITIKGASGCGKSTLLNIISLLLAPSSGSIKINDAQVDFKNEKFLVQQRGLNMGLVFQSPNLINCLTPVENILLGCRTKGESAGERKKRAKSLLDEVGLASKYNVNVKTLSGGEAQRVAIARALINKPQIIICDEPTGALDADNTEHILSLLEKMHEKEKCSLIVVTHDNSIWERGNKRLILEGGKIHAVV